MNRVVILPNVRIQNANALSSPITIGLPSMTAWLGAMHALQRKLNQSDYQSIKFSKLGLVSHEFELQTIKLNEYSDSSIIVTGNPLDRDGNRPAFVDEARCHLEVSLAFAVEGVNQFEDLDILESKILNILQTIKIASGDIVSCNRPKFYIIDDIDSHKYLLRSLMPGYALVERRELVSELMENGGDSLDAVLECISVKSRSEVNDQGHVLWTSSRSHPGWIIPISVGYQGLTSLANPGDTVNQRHCDYPHKFAESVVTVGEFVMPYRFNRVDDILWSYHYVSDSDLYVCRNR